jgi:hypothetical protein
VLEAVAAGEPAEAMHTQRSSMNVVPYGLIVGVKMSMLRAAL